MATVLSLPFQSAAASSAQVSEASSSAGTLVALFGGDKAKPKSQLKKKQREMARTLLSGLEKESHLILFSENEGCRECAKVKNLLEELSAMTPQLSLETLSLAGNAERAAELGIDKVPGIAILDGEKSNSGIRYFGTPLGFEFESFLEAIVNTAHGSPALQPETLAGLSLVKKPVTITIFVAQHWKYCPQVARVAYGMAIANEMVSAEIIDWEEFKKLGREFRVATVPKTFINYREPFAGVATELSILERVMEGQ